LSRTLRSVFCGLLLEERGPVFKIQGGGMIATIEAMNIRGGGRNPAKEHQRVLFCGTMEKTLLAPTPSRYLEWWSPQSS